jgi:hypothetical protein
MLSSTFIDKCEAIKNVKQPMEKPMESAHDGFSTSHFSEGMEWSSRVASQRFYCAGVLEGGRL